ncbi:MULTISPECIES: helix-turn-helix domain-containing protein [unclassified Streptomyces]|uniref:helix-turn-helix domain-containing protein n=1 Tax=unclassified Streptomyces TaxID=2593676 RepID=UPI002789D9CB|nr:helix-turn-helix domain-containing protein [Streptomyces sp. V1I6]MDQ0847561.1 hypothetical protein [Streptomyces sp. V1I6]
MPKILRIDLTADQCRDLHALLARRDLTRYTRQRLECIRLLDRGKTVPEVADLLECKLAWVARRWREHPDFAPPWRPRHSRAERW